MNEKKQEKPGAPNPENPKPQNPKPENPTPTAPKEGANKMESDMRGYPLYPDTEDVFAKDKEEKDIDPEDVTKKKTNNVTKDSGGDKVYVDDETGEDLDVPGNEADEKEENAGSEDEENNFYSLGGDDHNDLEEDKG
jgi:hypothetical protein